MKTCYIFKFILIITLFTFWHVIKKNFKDDHTDAIVKEILSTLVEFSLKAGR